METGPRLKVSSYRLVKPGIEPATPGLQGKRFIHYTTAAPGVLLTWLIYYKMNYSEFLQMTSAAVLFGLFIAFTANPGRDPYKPL